MNNNEKKWTADEIRNAAADIGKHQAAYSRLKARGDDEAASLIRALSTALVERGLELDRASKEVLDLYRVNSRLGDALAQKTLDAGSGGGLDAFHEMLRKSGIDVHLISKEELDRVREPVDDATKPEQQPNA